MTWNSNFSVRKERFTGTHCALLCTYCLWLRSPYSGIVEYVKQRTHDPQNLKCLFSGPSQKTFARLNHPCLKVKVQSTDVCQNSLLIWRKLRAHKLKKKGCDWQYLQITKEISKMPPLRTIISSGKHAIPHNDHQMATPMVAWRFINIYLHDPCFSVLEPQWGTGTGTQQMAMKIKN